MLNVISGIHSDGVAPDLGAYEAIYTSTVGAGGVTSITFNTIPSTYKHLQIRAISRKSSELFMRFNSDTAANYSKHYIYGTGSGTPTAGGVANQDLVEFSYNSGTSSTVYSATIVDILDYADTNKYKTTRNLDGNDRNGAGDILVWSGSWRSTSAISSILIYPSSGNIEEYSSFALYGIKG